MDGTRESVAYFQATAQLKAVRPRQRFLVFDSAHFAFTIVLIY
jgi:hypothetical protein